MTENNLEITQYVKETAKLIDLPISPEYRAGVVDNFKKIKDLASQITEFNLPENIEAAPIFKP